MLSAHVLLEVAGLSEAAGAQRASQPTAAVDALMATTIRQRRKALVALVARVRLHAYTAGLETAPFNPSVLLRSSPLSFHPSP